MKKRIFPTECCECSGYREVAVPTKKSYHQKREYLLHLCSELEHESKRTYKLIEHCPSHEEIWEYNPRVSYTGGCGPSKLLVWVVDQTFIQPHLKTWFLTINSSAIQDKYVIQCCDVS